jgi:hypothetical protein
LAEHPLPGSLRVQGAPVQQRTCGGFGSALRQHVELLFRSVVGPGKAEQLEEERASAGIRRVASYFGTQRFDGLIQPARSEQLLRAHSGPVSVQADTAVRSHEPTAGEPFEPSGFCGV